MHHASIEGISLHHHHLSHQSIDRLFLANNVSENEMPRARLARVVIVAKMHSKRYLIARDHKKATTAQGGTGSLC